MAGSSGHCRRNDFEIAIICALPLEADAVQALFDNFWDEKSFGKASGDWNTYTLGVLGGHNVVLVHMPRMGKTSAAAVSTSLRSSFLQINLVLVVGICGGVPNGTDEEKEILLGDVVISTGLVQYDFGRRFDHGFTRKRTRALDISAPNDEIQGFLNKLGVKRIRRRLTEKTSEYLSVLDHDRHYQNAKYLGVDEDRLFKATYRHKHHDLLECELCAKCTTKENKVCNEALERSCTELKCDTSQQVVRNRLLSQVSPSEISKEEVAVMQTMGSAHRPAIHFGYIASGDTVMKSGVERDIIAATEEVIAFEM